MPVSSSFKLCEDLLKQFVNRLKSGCLIHLLVKLQEYHLTHITIERRKARLENLNLSNL